MATAVIGGGGLVENIIVDPQPGFSLPGKTLVRATAGAEIGGTWDGSTFTPKPPETVTEERRRLVVMAAKFRIALDNAGLLAQFTTAANADPRRAIVWEYATDFERNSAFILAMTDATFTEAVLDGLFRAAMVETI